MEATSEKGMGSGSDAAWGAEACAEAGVDVLRCIGGRPRGFGLHWLYQHKPSGFPVKGQLGIAYSDHVRGEALDYMHIRTGNKAQRHELVPFMGRKLGKIDDHRPGTPAECV